MTTWVKADSIIVYKLASDRISKNDLENFFECHPWLWLYSTCQSNQCEFDMLPRLLSTSCHSGENGRSCRRYCISFRPRMQVLCCAMYILFHSSSSCVDMDRRYSYTIVLYMKHIYSIHWRGKRVQYAFLVCESPKTYTSTRSNAQCFFFFLFFACLDYFAVGFFLRYDSANKLIYMMHFVHASTCLSCVCRSTMKLTQ